MQQETLERAKKHVAEYLKKEVKDLTEQDLKLAQEMATHEADTASANTQVLRGPKKESFKIGFKPNLRENSKSKGSRYEIVLIEEGIGNLKDAYYYSSQAIQGAVQIFEGSAIYANHPSKTEEYDQPERTVEKKVGHIENVRAVKADDNRMLLLGDACILEGSQYEWVRTILNHSLKYREKYKGKEFVGFSINASGESEEEDAQALLSKAPQSAKEKVREAIGLGNDKIKVVTEITDCVSCDLVTQAGAGGRVLKILEEDKMSKKKTKEADEKPAGDKPHADEDQDKALIVDMIKKHMGDKGAPEESMAEIHENVEAYSEMGMEKEEAVKHACNEFKKECIKKEKAGAKENQEGDEEENKEQSMEKENQEQQEKHEEKEKPPVKETKEQKETNLKETESIKLTARVAMLETELKKERLEKYVDRKLAESGLPRSATKKFSETCKGEFASEKDFDLKFKIFSEAYKENNADYITTSDKGSGGEAAGSMSFADCVTE